MSNSPGNAGTVDVDGVSYDWHLQREPHLSDGEGWKGMTISILQQDAKREALLEFPPPKRLLKGLPRGRLQLDDATISRCVRAAMSAGWERCRAVNRWCSWSTLMVIETLAANAVRVRHEHDFAEIEI